MKVEDRLISSLKAADYNPRHLTEKQEADLTESLRSFGVVSPIVINGYEGREGIIIGGSQRCKIWAKLGYTSIPCIVFYLDESKERELNIRLNKNGGEFDYSMLREHFEVKELTAWGFKAFEVEVVEFEVADLAGDEEEEDEGEWELEGEETEKREQKESKLQIECVEWFKSTFKSLEQCLFSIPNGGLREKRQAVTLKKEGVTKGVSDLFLAIPNVQKGNHGLFMEMKTEEGVLSKHQKQFVKIIGAQGYRVEVVRSKESFKKLIYEQLGEE